MLSLPERGKLGRIPAHPGPRDPACWKGNAPSRRFLPNRIFLVLLTVGLIGWLAAPRPTVAEEKKAKTELHHQMEQIDTGMKKLRRTLRKKESNPESLEWITKIEEAAIACKQMTPSRATTLPSDQQAQFVISYRKQMVQLIGTMVKMESALLDDDNAKAQEAYKQLKDMEDEGHDKFMQDDEKDVAKDTDKK